ncbi:MAG: SUMF1/EgtB/PvdO family nonheme iron enzyme [Chitinophagales bacterium]
MKQHSPFKFLDAYQKADKDIFFGREKETNDLYDALSGVKHLLVYGPSGAGKTSLIECGLRNQFSDADWFALSIRRGDNINASVFARINEVLEEKIAFNPQTRLPEDTEVSFGGLVEQLFDERFQPVYLLFDQFEELLILGSDAEKKEFFTRLNELIRYKVPCRILLIMREEFIGHLSEFEALCPSIFKHRFRLEKMRKEKVRGVIYEMLEAEEYEDFYAVQDSAALANAILDKLPDQKKEIELTHVQVFLSELWDRAKQQQTPADKLPLLQPDLVTEEDDLEGVLNSFLKKQLQALNASAYGENTALEILAAMISERHTKLQISQEAIENDLQSKKVAIPPKLSNLLQDLEKRRLIRSQKAGEQTQYEISHDLLALAVGQNLTEEMQMRQKAGEVYAVYAERQGYFSQDELDFIRPYQAYKDYPSALEGKIRESEVFLKKEQERELQAARNQSRRLRFLLGAAFLALVFAGWQYWEADKARKEAVANEQKAKAALADVDKNEMIARTNLDEAEAYILELEYEKALVKIEVAAGLRVETLDSTILKNYMEPAFWYVETHQYDKAKEILKTALEHLPNSTAKGFLQKANQEGKERQHLQASLKALDEKRYGELQNRYYPNMIKVEGGIVEMEQGQNFRVELSDFKMAETETTVFQFALYCQVAYGDKWKIDGKYAYMEGATAKDSIGLHPVAKVNWYDAVQYCNWLSEQKGNAKAYKIDKENEDPNNGNGYDEIKWIVEMDIKTKKGYRLPTEAEWEYAAKGGELMELFEYSGSNTIEEVAWYGENSESRTHPVGSKKPNGKGLYDMSGNVWEWCFDWYGDYPENTLIANYFGLKNSSTRVLRGGSWNDFSEGCRVASRYSSSPHRRHYANGFRLAYSL